MSEREIYEIKVAEWIKSKGFKVESTPPEGF